MNNYEWNTVDGRFRVAGDIMKFEHSGKEKEAEELKETLREALAIYAMSEYYVLIDKANKQLLLLYGRRDAWDENAFDKFLRKHIDNYVCHVESGCTWMHGLICQQCEPIITTKKYEKWNVFETEDGQLWFEQM